MAISKNHDQLRSLLRQTRAILGLLVAQFLLGMGVNLIGTPGSTLSNVSKMIILALHVLLALGLVTLAALAVRSALKLAGDWSRQTRIGASGVGLAFVGGLGTMATQGTVSNWLSYLMSIGFILAFAGFSFLFAKLSAALAPR